MIFCEKWGPWGSCRGISKKTKQDKTKKKQTNKQTNKNKNDPFCGISPYFLECEYSRAKFRVTV